MTTMMTGAAADVTTSNAGAKRESMPRLDPTRHLERAIPRMCFPDEIADSDMPYCEMKRPNVGSEKK